MCIRDRDDGSCVTDLSGSVPLFFSEYAEGSSNNKYLEIYNPSSETVDLSMYAFPNVSNDPSTVGEYEYWQGFPEGAFIEPGDVYIVAHGSSDEMILGEADHTFNYLSNGDDGFALVYGFEGYTETIGETDCCINPDWIDPMAFCSFIYDPVIGCDGIEYSNACLAEAAGVTSYTGLGDGDAGYVVDLGWDCSSSVIEPNFIVLDRIGDWNGDPGSGWSVAGVSNGTKDHTLVRKCGILSGNSDWIASAGTNEDDSEWIVLDQNDWTYLGSHEIVCPEIILGCTDSSACNFNVDATEDDGTCGLVDDCGDCQIPYCYIVGGAVSYVSISDCAGGVLGNDNVTLFDGVWVGNDSSDTYWLGSSWNPYWNQNCSTTPGCMDTAACNYWYAATEDDGSCTYAVDGYDCDGNCLDTYTVIVDCLCTENESLVTWTEFDQASCTTFESCACECTNDVNNNGVCDEEEGCTDLNACNYDSTVFTDDGSCFYAEDGLSLIHI